MSVYNAIKLQYSFTIHKENVKIARFIHITQRKCKICRYQILNKSLTHAKVYAESVPNMFFTSFKVYLNYCKMHHLNIENA